MINKLQLLLIGGIVGAVCGWLLHGSSADAQNAAPLVRLDERKMEVSYVNAYRIHTSAEEVIIDVGFNMPNPAANAEGQAGDLLFYVSNRLIFSYTNAKRLELSLRTLIDRYEGQFGELPLAPSATQRSR